MQKIDSAITALKKGKFVLIHDSNSRENEIDLVIASEFVAPACVAQMRKDAGGLICLAVGREIANEIGLPFLADVEKFGDNRFPVLNYIKADDIPYDEKSSFSISINHRDTFTGITDMDRALTIREFGRFCKNLPEDTQREFGLRFRSPGHVPLLISSGLKNREGHTELSTALLKMAKLVPVAAICEMLDDSEFGALSTKKAVKYAEKHNLILIEADEIKERWQESA